MNNAYNPIEIPDFSKTRLHSKLDKLLAAYETKGMKVANSLLAPLSEKVVREKCLWFPGELPNEIVSLYAWRGGQEADAWDSDYPFWFRDNSFCSIERAEIEYKSMMDSYGSDPENHEMLKYSFPFASFNGGWYVLPTGTLTFNTTLKKPIVSVHQGVDIFFYTIETMVDTCVDWVNHPQYEDSLPDAVEMKIWCKHNPGIFNHSA